MTGSPPELSAERGAAAKGTEAGFATGFGAKDVLGSARERDCRGLKARRHALIDETEQHREAGRMS